MMWKRACLMVPCLSLLLAACGLLLNVARNVR